MPDQYPIPIWKILLITAAVIVLFVVISLINVYRKIPESYAAWTTGNLIVDYLNIHSNRWPQNWEDLEQATNCLRYVSIETLRTKVKIAWDSDFGQLLQAVRSNHTIPLKLVTRPDGGKLHAVWGSNTDPNNKIRGYLLWVLAEPSFLPDLQTNNSPQTQDSLH